jgi:diguanylate cyclase (GGDEF)-like protein
MKTAALGSIRSPAGPRSGAPRRGGTRSRLHPSRGATTTGAGSVLSTPLALSRTIERLVRVIPTAIWLALLAAVTLAAAAGAAALRADRRGRRQAHAIAAAEHAAPTDPLTGVLNRRGFGEAIERELARARRHGRPLALAYLDVRGLKAVNDGDGHLVGDQLIRQVAGLLRECARAGDVIGRLGGDEFALLLAEQSAEGAATVQTRLHAQVPARRDAIASDVPWELTIGTAAYSADGESFQTLLSVADRRLYAQRGIRLRAVT